MTLRTRTERDFRVVRQVTDGKETFTLREAYLGNGEKEPHSIAPDPAVPAGTSVRELYDELRQMFDAIKHPVIEEGSLPAGLMRPKSSTPPAAPTG
ncbi:unnamed protein product [marine sediment metagenome]|uniref:Uncharacterized protein n=1 Tax=marine sediment metagenome TaxID=412755 RepID=X0VIV4_9ZZZZ